MGDMSIKEVPIPIDMITSEIVEAFIKERKMSHEEAIETLYNSKLYALLEDAATGVWHYSGLTLYNLLCEEIDTGGLTLPEEQ